MALTEKERLLLEEAMKKDSPNKYSSIIDSSALSPDNDNRKVAEAALNAIMSQSEMGRLLRNATSTTAGAPVDPRAAVGPGLSVGPVINAIKNPLDATKAALYTVTGETMPFLQGAATTAAANIGDTANTLLLGMPVSDKMDKDFVLARDIVKRDMERAAMLQPEVAEHAIPAVLAASIPAIAAAAPGTMGALAARYTLPRLGTAALGSAVESMIARPSEYGKITNPKDLLNAQTAIETAIGTAVGPLLIKPGTKTKPSTKAKPADIAPGATPNPHLNRDIVDIERELKEVNKQRVKAARSNDKDALKTIDIKRKSLLEAQLIKRPELETRREELAALEGNKNAAFTEEGFTAYKTDEQLNAEADALELAKKKKTSGEGEGGDGNVSAMRATPDIIPGQFLGIKEKPANINDRAKLAADYIKKRARDNNPDLFDEELPEVEYIPEERQFTIRDPLLPAAESMLVLDNNGMLKGQWQTEYSRPAGRGKTITEKTKAFTSTEALDAAMYTFGDQVKGLEGIWTKRAGLTTNTDQFEKAVHELMNKGLSRTEAELDAYFTTNTGRKMAKYGFTEAKPLEIDFDMVDVDGRQLPIYNEVKVQFIKPKIPIGKLRGSRVPGKPLVDFDPDLDKILAEFAPKVQKPVDPIAAAVARLNKELLKKPDEFADIPDNLYAFIKSDLKASFKAAEERLGRPLTESAKNNLIRQRADKILKNPNKDEILRELAANLIKNKGKK